MTIPETSPAAANALRIVQLYPVELGHSGDRGNVDVLRIRAERAGLRVQVTLVSEGDEAPDADIVVIGNGPFSAMRGLADGLRARKEWLAAHLTGEGVLLAVGGGAELLGSRITPLEGAELQGLSLLPFHVRRTKDRRVGYVVARTPDGVLDGFEDHASEWTLEGGLSSYGRVTTGAGAIALGEGSRGEGVRVGNAFAFIAQGPLAPLNPWLADLLLTLGAQHAGLDYRRSAALDRIDAYADGARRTIERGVGEEIHPIKL